MKNDRRRHLSIDAATANKIQFKLKAAVYGTDPFTFFSRFDKDGGGSLDYEEFRKLMRIALKIPPRDLSDKSLFSFARALDDDGSGDLSIAELADFVVHGKNTSSNSLDELSNERSVWRGIEQTDRTNIKSHRHEIGIITAAESELLRRDILDRTGFVAPAYKDHDPTLGSVRLQFFDSIVSPKDHDKFIQDNNIHVLQSSIQGGIQLPSRPGVHAPLSSFVSSPLKKRCKHAGLNKKCTLKKASRVTTRKQVWSFEERQPVPPTLPIVEEDTDLELHHATTTSKWRKSGRPNEKVKRRSDADSAWKDYSTAKEMLENIIDPSMLIQEIDSQDSPAVFTDSEELHKTEEEMLREHLIRKFAIDPGVNFQATDFASIITVSELRMLLERDVATRDIEISSIPSRRRILKDFAKEHPLLEVYPIKTNCEGQEFRLAHQNYTTDMTVASYEFEQDMEIREEYLHGNREEDAATLQSRRIEYDSRSLYATMRAYSQHTDAARIGNEDAILAYLQDCENMKISPLPLMDYFVFRPSQEQSRALEFQRMKIAALPDSFTQQRSGESGRRKGGSAKDKSYLGDVESTAGTMISSVSAATAKSTNPFGVPIGGRCSFSVPGFGLGDKSVCALASFFSKCKLSIIELNLSDNSIGDDGGFQLMKVLPLLSEKLIKLDLSHNNFSTRTRAEMSKIFLPVKNEYPELQLLLLTKCSLTDACVAKLVQALAKGMAPVLRILNVGGNEMSKEKFALGDLLLADSLNGEGCPLKSLDVGWLNLNLQHIFSLSDALAQNARLTELTLAWNNFSSADAIERLAISLLKNIQITSLDLSYNRITAQGSEIFAHKLFGRAAQCTLQHLIMDGNQIGQGGSYLFVKEQAEKGRFISFQGCDFSFCGDTKFDPHNPDGSYIFDLSNSYHYTTVLRICEMTHHYQAVPGVEVWKNTTINGKKFTPPVKRLLLPLNSRYDKGTFDEIVNINELPQSGLLSFQFAMQVPYRAEKTSPNEFANHLKLLEGKDENQISRSLIELSKMKSFEVEQAASLLKFTTETNARVQACAYFIVHLSDRGRIDDLLDELTSLEQELCKERLGTFFWFSHENPTGSYKLNLEDEYDRRVAVELMDINRKERHDALEKGLPDLSENGDREYFRRVYIDKVPIEYKTNNFSLPLRGFMEFDYISPIRPSANAEEFGNIEFEVFLTECLTSGNSANGVDDTCTDFLKTKARKVFQEIDRRGSGYISYLDIYEAFLLLGIKISMKRTVELFRDTFGCDTCDIDISQFFRLLKIVLTEIKRTQTIASLRRMAPSMWITSKQLVKMLLEFSDDSINQAEIFTIFYGRTVDVPNMHLAQRVMTPDGWALLRQRFGDLFLFSPSIVGALLLICTQVQSCMCDFGAVSQPRLCRIG